MDREKVIADIEEQIAWIRDNDFHKFPGWGHAVLAMKDAVALLKEQETANIYKCPNCGTWVSAENVVRCKDCKAWKQYDDMNLGECELYPEYNKMGEWFCNFGERK